MHLQDTSDTLLLILRRIVHVRTGITGSGVHAEECQLTHEGISHNLKCQRRKRLLIGGMSHDFITVHIGAFDCLDVGRCGHILKNRVKKFLHALVSVSGTAAYGNRRTFTSALAQRLLQFFYGRLLALQIFHCQIIV